MYINKSIAFNNPDLSVGIRVPNTVERSTDFLIKRVKDYDRIQEVDIHQTMDLCDRIYRYEGTCGTAIDIFVDFAVTRLRAEQTGEKDLDKMLEHFNDQVNSDVTSTMRGIHEVLQKVCFDWFINGNAFPYTSWDNIDLDGITAPVKMPTRVVLLNPKFIRIPQEKMMLGSAQLFFSPPATMLSMLDKDGRSNPGVRDLKSLNIFKKKNATTYGYTLNPKFVKHIKRKGNDYNAWGTPYLTKAFSSLASIRRLRRLDDSTTEGLVNLVTIYKIGDKDFPAKPGRLNAFRALIQNPTSTQTLVWAHDVSVEQVGPDGKVLAFDKKYIQPQQELLRALGVPAILIDPSITKGADPYVSVIAMSERLEQLRSVLKIYVEDIYKQIAEANGFKGKRPKARWSRMNLSNDQSIKNFIMQFYDRGLIDPKTALEEANYDYETITTRKKKFKKDESMFKPPELPFGGNSPDKGRPIKGSPKDKTPRKLGTKPAVDQKVKIKPSKPKVKVAASEEEE